MARILLLQQDQWANEAKSAGPHHHFYIVQESDNGPVKIGIARNAFWRRSDMQSGNPRQIIIKTVYRCETRVDAILLEAASLAAFSDRRILGEWLNATPSDVLAFVECEVAKCRE